MDRITVVFSLAFTNDILFHIHTPERYRLEITVDSLSVADHLAKNRRFLPGGQMKEIQSLVYSYGQRLRVYSSSPSAFE